MLNKIHDLLPAVSSVCFSLTCKGFWTLYKNAHGKVTLDTELPGTGYGAYIRDGTMLANYLKRWMPRRLRWYNYQTCRFTTKEQFSEEVILIQDEERLQMAYDYEEFYPGLERDDIYDLVDEWMRKNDILGWRYQTRYWMIEPYPWMHRKRFNSEGETEEESGGEESGGEESGGEESGGEESGEEESGEESEHEEE